MSEERECPKCGEKMIYYPGRRSFGKTGKYICKCKDSGKTGDKFVCGGGCGNFTINEMKRAKSLDDPTLVCPKCGGCGWFITSIKAVNEIKQRWIYEDSGGGKTDDVQSSQNISESHQKSNISSDSKPTEQDWLNDQWNDGERPFESKDGGCVLIRNAQNDPDWDGSLNAELCKGDCQSCPHYEPKVNELTKLEIKIKEHKIIPNQKIIQITEENQLIATIIPRITMISIISKYIKNVIPDMRFPPKININLIERDKKKLKMLNEDHLII